jgi:Spy/CpxP family protein refolding chaperone
MKKLIFGIVLLAFATASLQAQPGGGPGPKGGERVKSMRIAYITNKLSLTPEESQQFWPVFNQFEADQKKIHEKYKPTKDLMSMTDAEADKFLNSRSEMEQEMLNLRKNYVSQMRKVIPVRKVAMLMRVEQDFREELIGAMQQRRSEGQGASPRRPMQRNR